MKWLNLVISKGEMDRNNRLQARIALNKEAVQKTSRNFETLFESEIPFHLWIVYHTYNSGQANEDNGSQDKIIVTNKTKETATKAFTFVKSNFKIDELIRVTISLFCTLC